ncbi:FG-GAP repeat domain-containing protein, partial [Candidatus Roseilinea sp. NK_OTU-006]|uniref:FG-GAP repeat domain-containing protein n=1 Tax=Candidatus Roseilinea sp. NK_OTU-006 TaxID=2704250 RepID=UPI00145D508E
IKWSYPVGGAPGAWVEDITGPGGLPDGQPEVIVAAGGRVRAFDITGKPLWISEALGGFIVAIKDVNGDGSVEIVLGKAVGASTWERYTLSGSTGQVWSKLTGVNSYSGGGGALEDLNNDGRQEFIPQGFGDRYLYSYPSAITAPPQPVVWLTPAGGVNGLYGGFGFGDLDGDGYKEAVLAYERYTPPQVMVVTSQPTWTVLTRTFGSALTGLPPGATRRTQVIVTDTVVGDGKAEFLYFGYAGSTNYGYLLHNVVSTSPTTYTVTTTWFYTASVPYYGLSASVANLDGGDREVLLNYTEAGSGQRQARLFDANTGNILFSAQDVHFCGLSSYDADPDQEVGLCRQVPAGTEFRLYNWDGATLSPMWTTSITVRGLQVVHLDLTGDNIADVLAETTDRKYLAAYNGASGAFITQFPYPAGATCGVGGAPATFSPVRLPVACNNGYLYMLDATLSPQWSTYAGSATADFYVVDSNADSKNEIVLVDARGALINLDPYTATQQAAPKLNWERFFSPSVGLPSYWHPVNLDGGPWEYPVVDGTLLPTATVQLLHKNPLDGSETIAATGIITGTSSWIFLAGYGQLDNSTAENELLLHDFPYNRPLRALRQNGSTLTQLWLRPGIIHEESLAALADVTGDGHDDVFIRTYGSTPALLDGSNGNWLNGYYASWAFTAMVAELDGDPQLEFAPSQGDGGSMHLIQVLAGSPWLSGLQTRALGDKGGQVIRHRGFAVAEVTSAEGGLELIYGGLGGIVGAASGVNLSDFYTRGLGVSFNVGSCESFINQPVAYAGQYVDSLESVCPGALRLSPIRDVAVADVDGDGKDEILAASENGYLYALNAEDGSLRWAYNFYYPVDRVIAANVDTDPQLEVLVSVADGFLYAL